jgi:cell fate regulator YaaT (PSP1 superfamily)
VSLSIFFVSLPLNYFEMRNDNNRRRNNRRREGSEPQTETNQNIKTAENKPVEDNADKKDNNTAASGQEQVKQAEKEAQKEQNGGKDRKKKDNNRRHDRKKVSGERLLKDPELVHSEDESEEDREYFDTMTAEELEEATRMMRRKTASVDKQDLESNVPAGEDWEPYLDMDIRTGVSYEADKIAGNIFHTRGLKDTPNPERAHCEQYQYSSCKLPSYNWMDKLEIGLDYLEFPIAEVRFKNSHKDFFLLPPNIVFKVGDIVAVEANPGHDIGIVSMLGLQVQRQMQAKRVKPEDVVKKLYRHARYADIEEWIATVDKEYATMLSSRYTAWDLDLKMKVNDVEYQGDGTKAIFYYSAEERVDFRELIKILAEQFHIRIEMRQIGVRQEAARLGGIGSCGRELCCSQWLTNFQSVSTNTARTQQLSLNPQKLAGMCGKLKCCLNFEQDTYQRELKEFPSSHVVLKTQKGKGIYNKIDIFKKIVWYSYEDDPSTIFSIPLERVKQIIKMNEQGKMPENLEGFAVVNQKKMEENNNVSAEELKHIADS